MAAQIPARGGSDLTVSPVPRLALRLSEVAASLGISERTAWSWVKAGKLPQPAVKLGKVRLWGVDQLWAWLAGER